jgi:hypothetical protein
MDFDEHRIMLSGFLGALVASLLCLAWARWLPKGRNSKDARILLLEHKLAVSLANWSFLAGIGLALVLYFWGDYASNDWRPMALGGGVAFSAPLLVLPAVAFFRRCSPVEAYIAFALDQRTPVFVLYPLLAIGVPLLVLAITHL